MIFDTQQLALGPMEVQKNNEVLTLENICFISSDQQQCVVCSLPVCLSTFLMPKAARLDLLLFHRLYAQHGVRCCTSHLLNGSRLRPDEPINIKIRLPVLLPYHLQKLVKFLTTFFV